MMTTHYVKFWGSGGLETEKRKEIVERMTFHSIPVVQTQEPHILSRFSGHTEGVSG